MITALRTMFGDATTQSANHASLMATFNQEPGEAKRTFAECIGRHFAHDLGGGWDEWPQVMRRHFIKRFLLGMLESAFHHPANPQDVGYLADLSWLELITQANRLDQSMLPALQPQREPPRRTAALPSKQSLRCSNTPRI